MIATKEIESNVSIAFLLWAQTSFHTEFSSNWLWSTHWVIQYGVTWKCDCESLSSEMSAPEVIQDELLHFHPCSFQCRLIRSFYTNLCIKIKQAKKFRQKWCPKSIQSPCKLLKLLLNVHYQIGTVNPTFPGRTSGSSNLKYCPIPHPQKSTQIFKIIGVANVYCKALQKNSSVTIG